jgi:hypothetical protein
MMALIRSEQTPAGLLTYHRISQFKVLAGAALIEFTIESFADRAAREQLQAPGLWRDFEAPFAGGEVIPQAYAALMLNPQWQDAQSDSSETPPQPTAMAMPIGQAQWDGAAWIFPQGETWQEAKTRALQAIDNEAGQTRLKYITSVPGQAETYQRKEQQAREWQASGFVGAPPPFIDAEAIALEMDPQAIALNIITLADYWSNIKGPEIEATRRKWKVAIEAAGQDVIAINAALASGIEALGAL